MTRKASSVAEVQTASIRAVRRGPQRSARVPSGTPASIPAHQPTVSATPTRVADRPTIWVKNSAEVA